MWRPTVSDLFPGRDASRAHLDMGGIAVIATNPGITAMRNFRVSNLALGRQGYAIFTPVDSLLFDHLRGTAQYVLLVA